MNADAARRALEMSDEDVSRRALQSRMMVVGTDPDVLWAAIAIIERNVHVVAHMAGRAMVAIAWGYARALLQTIAVGLDKEDRAS